MIPKLSIILPTLRPVEAYHCIKTIEATTYGNYEIILVSTEEIIESLIGLADRDVIDDKLCGTTHAINEGLKRTTGDYIVCLSDDARTAPHWNTHMINFLESFSKEEIILGNFRVYDSSGEMGTIGYYGHPFSIFPLISRKNIEKLGVYYSTDFNAYFSDPNLGLEVWKQGGQVKTCPVAFIYHVFNPDQIYQNNKSKYWKKDEETFIKNWKHLGEFEGCQIISRKLE